MRKELVLVMQTSGCCQDNHDSSLILAKCSELDEPQLKIGRHSALALSRCMSEIIAASSTRAPGHVLDLRIRVLRAGCYEFLLSNCLTNSLLFHNTLAKLRHK